MPSNPEPVSDMPETDLDDLRARPDSSEDMWRKYLQSRHHNGTGIKIVNIRDFHEDQIEERQNTIIKLGAKQKDAAHAFMERVYANEDLTAKLAQPGVRSLGGNPIGDEMVDQAHRYCRKLCTRLENLQHKSAVTQSTMERLISTDTRLRDYSVRLKRSQAGASPLEQPAYQQVQEELSFMLTAWKDAGMADAFSYQVAKSNSVVRR